VITEMGKREAVNGSVASMVKNLVSLTAKYKAHTTAMVMMKHYAKARAALIGKAPFLPDPDERKIRRMCRIMELIIETKWTGYEFDIDDIICDDDSDDVPTQQEILREIQDVRRTIDSWVPVPKNVWEPDFAAFESDTTTRKGEMWDNVNRNLMAVKMAWCVSQSVPTQTDLINEAWAVIDDTIKNTIRLLILSHQKLSIDMARFITLRNELAVFGDPPVESAEYTEYASKHKRMIIAGERIKIREGEIERNPLSKVVSVDITEMVAMYGYLEERGVPVGMHDLGRTPNDKIAAMWALVPELKRTRFPWD
jgi:hypothetical protein